jgi:hypothetical protein
MGARRRMGTAAVVAWRRRVASTRRVVAARRLELEKVVHGRQGFEIWRIEQCTDEGRTAPAMSTARPAPARAGRRELGQGAGLGGRGELLLRQGAGAARFGSGKGRAQENSTSNGAAGGGAAGARMEEGADPNLPPPSWPLLPRQEAPHPNMYRVKS